MSGDEGCGGEKPRAGGRGGAPGRAPRAQGYERGGRERSRWAPRGESAPPGAERAALGSRDRGRSSLPQSVAQRAPLLESGRES